MRYTVAVQLKHLVLGIDEMEKRLDAYEPLLQACQEALKCLTMDSDLQEDFAKEIKQLTQAIQQAKGYEAV